MRRWILSPKWLLAAPLLIILMAAVACGDDPTPTPTPQPTPTPTATPLPSTPTPTAMPDAGMMVLEWVARGKQTPLVKMASCCNITDWDLHRACCGASPAAASKLYNMVMELNPVQPDHVIGDLAKTWEQDGLSFTFELHEAAMWNDGVPITAQDVEYSLNRMMETGVPRPRVSAVGRYIKSIDVIDDHTIKVNLKGNPSAFLNYLAVDYMTVLPKHAPLSGSPPGDPKQIVGSGPYVFEEWEKGVSYTVKKNPSYWKEGRPFINEIQSFVIGPTALTAALKTEQVIMMGLGFTRLSTVDNVAMAKELEGQVDVFFLNPNIIVALILNTTKPPFDDPRVRRAFTLAIDRQEIRTAGDGEKGSIGAPFPPHTGGGWGSTSATAETWPGNRQPKDQDIAEAKSLMAAAGVADGFKTDIISSPSGSQKQLAELIKFQMKKNLGIDITIMDRDNAARQQLSADGDFFILTQTHGLNIHDPDDLFNTLYLPGATRNLQGYVYPGLQELFDAQANEGDPVKRQALILQAEDILRAGEGHWVPVYWSEQAAWPVNKKVKNFFMGPSVTVQNMYKFEHIWVEE